ncbi:MAG TPA: FG-GAP-like repeat-containing protein, partial [Bacteroidales bacterium]|nr:FG-GAP-like repeat-containing protein [Bacteroidales bacterium]
AGTDLYVDGYCIFYRNDSGGHFTRFDHPPAALLNPYFDIADYNADGLPDVLMIGASPGCGGPPVTLLLKNQGGFDFTDVSTLIPGFKLGCVNWGDGNGDGYPDLLLTGLDAYDVAHTALYLNNLGDTTLFQINTAPSQPSGTSAGMEGDHAVLQWNPATDLQTPAASLTYNLSIGTTPGGSDILSPLSDTATGFCRLSCMGNAGYDTAWIVSGIPAGTYYFSVQPVDAGFLAGEFSAPCPFAYLPVGMNEPGLPGITVYPNPCREFVRLEAPTRAGSPEPVQIFNSLGIKFFEGRIPATLDVSRWPEGIYLLDQPGKVRTKLVKQ